MPDNFGVLGSSFGGAVQTYTVYTCPLAKAAKFKLFIYAIGSATSTITFYVNDVPVASVPAMTAGQSVFSNGNAGLIRAPAAAGPLGTSAAETAQPSTPIYYLSAGGTVRYTVGSAALQAANVEVVGIEVDLTL